MRALEKLEKGYDSLGPFYTERDIVWTIQKILRDITKQSSYKVFNDYSMQELTNKGHRGKSLQKLRNLNTQLIIIFGSYAKGTENNRSDIDIYLETPRQTIKRKAQTLNRKFSIKIGQFSDNLLTREIEKNHIIVKGVERFYETWFKSINC